MSAKASGAGRAHGRLVVKKTTTTTWREGGLTIVDWFICCLEILSKRPGSQICFREKKVVHKAKREISRQEASD